MKQTQCLPQPKQLQLFDTEVRQAFSKQLNHLLSEAIDGYSCDRQVVSDMLIKASVTGAALEGTCNSFRDAPTGMTVRSYLNDELSITALQEIECKMRASLRRDLPQRLWKHALNLAMDFHDEPFYGKDPTLRAYSCRGEAFKGTTWFYRVATVYVIHKQVPYALGMVFVLPEYSAQKIVADLLHQIKTLNLRIRGLYLDKGFCAEPVITFLKSKPYEVIIACPIRGKKGGTRALCKGRKSYFTNHTFCSGQDKAYSAPIAIARSYQNRHGRRRAVWLLYVVLNTSTQNPQTIRARYRARFGIETNYRCMRQTHAMTTSRNPALRFFLLGLAFLVINLWCVLRWRFCQVPRRGGRFLKKQLYELQRHRQFLAQAIDAIYHPVSSISACSIPLDL